MILSPWKMITLERFQCTIYGHTQSVTINKSADKHLKHIFSPHPALKEAELSIVRETFALPQLQSSAMISCSVDLFVKVYR